MPTASATTTAAAPVLPPAVAKVAVKFSYREKPTWTWNGAKWMRAEGKVKFTNPEGDQLGVDNLVLLYVRTIDAGYHDPVGNYVPRTVITGSGDGYLLTAANLDATQTIFQGGLCAATWGTIGTANFRTQQVVFP